jgi:magnesium-transporting ATPase (P-type)
VILPSRPDSRIDVAVLEHMEVHKHIKAESRFAKVDEILFDFQRRRMSVVVAEQGGPHILICKGRSKKSSASATGRNATPRRSRWNHITMRSYGR